jgi:hypothetical protein
LPDYDAEMSTINQPHTNEPAEQIVHLLSSPQMFEHLVDRLPDPLAIESLKHWGFLRGLYPREKALQGSAVHGHDVLEWLREALSQPGALAYLRARRHRSAARRLLWVAERLGIEG